MALRCGPYMEGSVSGSRVPPVDSGHDDPKTIPDFRTRGIHVDVHGVQFFLSLYERRLGVLRENSEIGSHIHRGDGC